MVTIGKLKVNSIVAGVAIIALGGLAGCGAQPSQSAAPSSAPSTNAQSPNSNPGTATPTSSGTRAPTPATATPSRTPAPTSTPTSTQTKAKALMKKGSTGDQVRQLQSRLKQIGWFTGKISPSYGDQTVTAVKGFQQKRTLSQTGEVDQKSWDALVEMTRQPTDDELHNRLTPGPALMKQGSTGEKVRELQARLKSIGWYSGDVTGYYGSQTTTDVEGFQQKREIPETGEVDRRTWDRLATMTKTPTKGELHNIKPKPEKKEDMKAAGLDSRCMSGRVICISKAQNQLVWVVDGNAKLRVDVRFGSDETPTREGVFSVFMKSRDHVSTLFHTSMPYAMFFAGGQAVHFSPDFAARGYNGASHGCVNVRNKQGVIWLFDQVRLGDKVVVYR